MLLPDLLLPFGTIALAELGDKSQILILLLASRTKKHGQLLLGVMLGFVAVDGFAIGIGSWVVNLIPAFWVKIVAGLLFMILGGAMLLAKKEGTEKKPELQNPFWTGFLMVGLAEWGDKTQIASALFATQYNPFTVFIAVMGALLLLSLSAVYVGKSLAPRLNPNITAKVSGFIFITMGVLSLLSLQR